MKRRNKPWAMKVFEAALTEGDHLDFLKEKSRSSARALEPGPEEIGVRVMPTSDVTQRRFFHEPFSETESWILRSETGKISKAGRYYLVGFSPEGHTDKVWLSIENEDPSRR